MFGLVFAATAEGLTGEQRLQLVAVLLGVLVFGAVILVVERRNHGHEATPPGMTARELPRPAARQVYRPPSRSVPTMSTRPGAVEEAPANPYPVPFAPSGDAVPGTGEPPPATPPGP